MHTHFWSENLKAKKAFGGPSYRWEDNIEMNLQETGCEAVD